MPYYSLDTDNRSVSFARASVTLVDTWHIVPLVWWDDLEDSHREELVSLHGAASDLEAMGHLVSSRYFVVGDIAYELDDFIRINHGSDHNAFTYRDWDGKLSHWDGIDSTTHYKPAVIRMIGDDLLRVGVFPA